MDLNLDKSKIEPETFKEEKAFKQEEFEPGIKAKNENTVASKDGLYTVEYTKSENNSDNLNEENINDSKMIVMEHLYVQVSQRLDGYCKVNEHGLYKCIHCPQACPSIEEFKSHYKEKHLETSYDCIKCGLSTLCQETISDHISRYHDNDSSLVKVKLIRKVPTSSDQDQLANQSSKKRSISGTSRKMVKMDTDGGQQQTATTSHLDKSDEAEFNSDIEKMDHDSETYDDSETEGRSRYECKICHQKFTRPERVREHHDANHLNIVYTCSICEFTNKWKRSLIQHLKSKHDKTPPYKHLMLKKKLDSSSDFSNKPAAFGNLAPNIEDNTPTVSSCPDLANEDDEEDCDDDDNDEDDDYDEEDDDREDNVDNEIEERKVLPVDQQLDFDSHDNAKDVEAQSMEDGSDVEIDLSTSNSTTQKSNLPCKSKPSEFPNYRSQPHKETLWACKICGFSHKWPLIMTNHLRIFHKSEPPFDQYILKIEEEVGLQTCEEFNPKPIQNYPCKLCDIAFETLRGLKEHTDDMHTDLVWSCKHCQFTNKWRPLAISHLRSAHNGQPPYTDHLVRKSANRSYNIPKRPQLIVETNAPPAPKPSTSASINQPQRLELPAKNSRELGINTKECYKKLANDQYQCTKCTKTCGSAQGVTEHFEAFHLNMLYHCQLCDFTDVWRSMMTKHLRQKHQLGKPYDEYLKRVKLETADSKLVTDIQMDNFRRRSHSLKASDPATSHLSKRQSSSSVSASNGATSNKTPRGSVSNGRSPISSSQNGNVQNVSQESKGGSKHITRESKDSSMGKQYIHLDNQLKCKLCGSVFTSLQGFQEHYEAIHLDVIWTCRKCPTSFRWRQQLTKHLKLIHECEPPFNEYMLKEAGSHKLKKPIPEKSPHGAYSRRPILSRGSSGKSNQGMDVNSDSSS